MPHGPGLLSRQSAHNHRPCAEYRSDPRTFPKCQWPPTNGPDKAAWIVSPFPFAELVATRTRVLKPPTCSGSIPDRKLAHQAPFAPCRVNSSHWGKCGAVLVRAVDIDAADCFELARHGRQACPRRGTAGSSCFCESPSFAATYFGAHPEPTPVAVCFSGGKMNFQPMRAVTVLAPRFRTLIGRMRTRGAQSLWGAVMQDFD